MAQFASTEAAKPICGPPAPGSSRAATERPPPAAQARAPVDCPTLQAIGPQATNQAVKAIAIARTFLKESQDIDICMQARATHSARNSPPRIAQF